MSENEKANSSKRGGYFRDRTVVVTGASSGIGQDVAMAFADRGAQVGMLARRKGKLEELVERIKGLDGRAMAVECDVTRRAEVQAAIEEVQNSFGDIDILVNCAGLMIQAKVEEMRPEDLERMMAVNLYGAVHAIQTVLPRMRERSSGRIITIGSLAAWRGTSPIGGYSASKSALVGLTEALRIELFNTGVSASLVMPGVIDTPMSQKARDNKTLRAIPMFAMPVRWVTWGVLAAAALGLPEIDIPPGAAIVEKIATLFPFATDTLLGLGTRIAERMGERAEKREAAAKAASDRGGTLKQRREAAGASPKTAA